MALIIITQLILLLMIRFLPTLIALLSLSPIYSFHTSDVQDDDKGLNPSEFQSKQKQQGTYVFDTRLFNASKFLNKKNTFWLPQYLDFSEYIPHSLNLDDQHFTVLKYLIIIDDSQFYDQSMSERADLLHSNITDQLKKWKNESLKFSYEGYNKFSFDDEYFQNQTFNTGIIISKLDRNASEKYLYVDVSFPYEHEINHQIIIQKSLAINMNFYLKSENMKENVRTIFEVYLKKKNIKQIRVISASVNSAKFFYSYFINELRQKANLTKFKIVYDDASYFPNTSFINYQKFITFDDNHFKSDQYIRNADSLENENQLYEIPVMLCIITHLFCTSFFLYFVYKKRNQYPHKQSSPILTCTIQISLFLANCCLVLGRIAMIKTLTSSKQKDERNTRELCENLYQLGTPFVAPDLLYTFFQEVIIFSFLLKLIRLLLIFYSKIYLSLKKIFQSQFKLLGLSIIWALIWMVLQLSFKLSGAEGFQFYTFLCDSKCSNQPSNWGLFSVYFIRIVLFQISFGGAYALTYKVDDKLNFRYQYAALIIVYNVPFLSEFFLHRFDSDCPIDFICSSSSAFLVYYMSLLCNLSISFFMLLLHIFSYQEEDFRLDFPELLKARDLSYIFKQNVDCKVSFQAFCKHEGKSDLFDCYLNVIDDDLDQYEDQEEDYIDEIMKLFYKYELIEKDIQKLKTKDPIIYKRLTENSSKLELAKIRRQYTREMLSQTVIEWEETEAYNFILEDMGNNVKNNDKMQELNLI